MARTPDSIDEQAAQWAVRLAAGPLPAPEQREFDAWRAVSPRHEGALIRARATWLAIDRLIRATGAGASGVGPVSSAGPVPSVDPAARLVTEPAPARRWNRRYLLAAGFAGLAAAGAVSTWLALNRRGQTYVSEVGGLREIALPDGSNMLLNTATRAVERFGESHRDVLLEEGEALFEVVTDPARPFVVHAGDLTVTAVGTAFSVRRQPGRVDILVAEGVVEVVRPGGAGTASRITANQRAVVPASAGIEVQTLERADVARRLAWREGKIAFNGEPLRDAVAEINRHSRRRIVVEDPELAAVPIVGIFSASDVDAFADMAAVALGAQVVREDDVIRLRGDDSTPAR